MLPTPLVPLMTNHRRIVLLDICFIVATIAIWSRFDFQNCKCENTFFIVWTVVVFDRFLQKTLHHWLYNMTTKGFLELMFLSIILP
jgi:hypothetical protein